MRGLCLFVPDDRHAHKGRADSDQPDAHAGDKKADGNAGISVHPLPRPAVVDEDAGRMDRVKTKDKKSDEIEIGIPTSHPVFHFKKEYLTKALHDSDFKFSYRCPSLQHHQVHFAGNGLEISV